MKAMSAGMIDVAWNITVLDIESTLRTSISKIFRDKSVDEKGRKQRAKGLLNLAKIFKGHGSESSKGIDDFKEMVRSQMQNKGGPPKDPSDQENASKEPWACANCTF
jgi:hypothetical protein